MSSSSNGRHKACHACRERKVRCDGGTPKCGRCSKSSMQCFYALSSKRLSRLNHGLGKSSATRGFPLLPNLSLDMFSNPTTSYGNTDFPSEGTTHLPTQTQDFAPAYTRDGGFDFNTGGGHARARTGSSRSDGDAPRTEWLSKKDFNKAMNALVGFQESVEPSGDDFPNNYSPELSANHPSSASTHRFPGSSNAVQYVNNNQAMATDFWGSGNHSSSSSAPQFSPPLQDRPSNDYSKKRRRHPGDDDDSTEDRTGEMASRPSTGLQSATLSSTSSNESSLTPCGTTNRRIIGNGAAFNAVSPLRGTENYLEWARAIRVAARKEGVWGTICGSCVKPKLKAFASAAEQHQYQEDVSYWANMNDLALGGLEGSLEKDLQVSVDHIACSREMWLKLERDYSPTDSRILYGLVERLDGISWDAYDGVEKIASEILSVLKQMAILKQTQKLPEWYFSMRFLHSLGPAYSEFVSDIIASKGVLTHEGMVGGALSFQQVVAEALSEERRRN
ncbi:hypothetical protein BKA61DRAFT_611901 [Leptodontidium sp. MPI-SDFR-AT-0119]|nr:hypothetical protein BKA61DRAFT_611901 [Leptodontidium sp. MPI-SDFR-AT-0119]